MTNLKILAQNDQKHGCVFVADVISNFNQQQAEVYAIHSLHDIFLSGGTNLLKIALQPTLLITCGQSLISKALKQFLRQFPPKPSLAYSSIGGSAGHIPEFNPNNPS